MHKEETPTDESEDDTPVLTKHSSSNSQTSFHTKVVLLAGLLTSLALHAMYTIAEHDLYINQVAT